MLKSVALLLAVVPQPNLNAPRRFITSLYTRYSTGAFEVLGREAGHVFTPSLASAIRRDAATHAGFVGKLDFDPICSCQDPDGLRVEAVSLEAEPNSQVLAVVRLHFRTQDTVIVTLNLIPTAQGWRVFDVSNRGMPSLRELLAANPEHKDR